MPTVQAVIVEPREHPALPMVVGNVCDKRHVPIIVIHGTANQAFAESKVSRMPCVSELLEVNAPNLDSQSYSKLLTSAAFWDRLQEADKTLIFQTDSGICGPGEDLDLFMSYDYCGAPWEWEPPGANVGNGGFSLRTSSVALRHAQQHGPSMEHEDVEFVGWCQEDAGCHICPTDVAKKFSTESVPSPAWAFHNNGAYTDATTCPFNAQINAVGPVEWEHPVPDVEGWDPVLT